LQSGARAGGAGAYRSGRRLIGLCRLGDALGAHSAFTWFDAELTLAAK
jgi:hypothetical protein